MQYKVFIGSEIKTRTSAAGIIPLTITLTFVLLPLGPEAQISVFSSPPGLSSTPVFKSGHYSSQGVVLKNQAFYKYHLTFT
jgi:hypothetical protein